MWHFTEADMNVPSKCPRCLHNVYSAQHAVAQLMMGRDAEAIRRAEAFDRRWPGSLLRGTFRAALEAVTQHTEAVVE